MGAELTVKEIGQRIYFIRGHRVMLDSDLAEMYEVPSKRLNEQVSATCFHRTGRGDAFKRVE